MALHGIQPAPSVRGTRPRDACIEEQDGSMRQVHPAGIVRSQMGRRASKPPGQGPLVVPSPHAYVGSNR